MITAHQISEVYAHVLRTTESPLTGGFLTAFFGFPPRLYRDHLDRVRFNYYNEPIPRIEIVRANIRRLGDPHLPPARLR